MTPRYISFNPIRSIGIPCVAYLKPQNMVHSIHAVKNAIAVLFPEYWQINPLVYALKKRIFPSVSTYHLGHDKVEMTRSLQMLCPENVLKTGIFSNENICFDELVAQFGLPFVCKQIRSSSGLGVFLIRSLNDYQCYAQMNPVIYAQEYVPMERDLRIVIVGERVVSAYWRVGGTDHFHNNVSRGGMICRTDIPTDIVERVLQVAQALEVNHAGFDVAVTSHGIYVLEFNLYFGTQGIPFSSYELGKIINHYLLETVGLN
ncbi:hypothetical protein [uncultured Desulfobacter sp.]|uniref:ATP-grasp domain-containing protein n=1 Tax=uncultured Desulfobacter sp. TaxID=240139 RepID=UPI002AA6BED5|nr:hypothetical protein [uncultured Desulfobacter sp.]